MTEFLDEPNLEFRHGQVVADPHVGLSLFGPYDGDTSAHPAKLSYILIGTVEGLAMFQAFAERLAEPILPDSGKEERLWPLFPGFQATFDCEWPSVPVRQFVIDRTLLDRATREADQRTWMAVDLYLAQIRRLAESDERISVVICVVPEFVWKRCRPQSFLAKTERLGHRPSPKERRSRRQGQRGLFDEYEVDAYQFSVDFRRQLKARSMEFGIPLQIVRESALAVESGGKPETPISDRMLSPLSDRAWNLGVALYYKAGGKPWRLNTARPGVCYVGLAFRREDPAGSGRSAACAAQMFLNTEMVSCFLASLGLGTRQRTARFTYVQLTHETFLLARYEHIRILEALNSGKSFSIAAPESPRTSSKAFGLPAHQE